MHEAIAHRGPDGLGEYIDGPFALGHRRLSIIDLAGGRQPLSNETATVWVSFNGEIYNYVELRAELQSLGHVFRTRSDTEVLVHGYEEFGPQFVNRLNGMFAFAIYDAPRERLLLARDQVGVKPLFYAVTGEGLFFGSEIKAVLAGSGLSPRVAKHAVNEYLLFRYNAGSRTFFEGVRRLPPAHIAVWERGELRVSSYWEPPREALDRSPEREPGATFDSLLRAAVARQLMSDVPLGTFCSGGIDSGLVTAFASKARPGPIHTFSVGFENPEWDETPLARDTSRRYGTKHHNLTLSASDIPTLLSSLVWHNDEPLSHPNSVPLYLLSRLAREQVTVVLTGEGSDELFCGYPRYQIARLRSALRMVPRPILRSITAPLSRASGHRARLLAELLPHGAEHSMLLNSMYVSPALAATLTGTDPNEALDERMAILQRVIVRGDPLATLSRYEMSTYLGCALDRMDRMSMAASLEGRVPFLDVPLVEWGCRIASREKMRGTQGKLVVKSVASRYLSARIVNQPKSGFGLPLGEWFRTRAFAPLLDRLRDESHPAANSFDKSIVRELINGHVSGTADNSAALWALINIYTWFEVFSSRSASSPLSDQRGLLVG
jgi:asparagine synthase (glutamine-hydrolysing)